MDRGQCDKGGNCYSVGFEDRLWVLTGVPFSGVVSADRNRNTPSVVAECERRLNRLSYGS
jgi:hypothetical protein